MTTPVADLLLWLSQYKYFLLFPLVALEGPITTVVAGFLASMGHMEFFIALVVIICGDLTGDIIYYLFGRLGGRPWIRRWGHYIGIGEKRMAKLEAHFKKHPARTLLLGKLAHGFGGPVLAAAGLADMPFGKFILFDAAPTIPKSLIFLLLGFYFGLVNNHLNSIIVILISISVILFLIFYIIPWISQRCLLKNNSNHANPNCK